MTHGETTQIVRTVLREQNGGRRKDVVTASLVATVFAVVAVVVSVLLFLNGEFAKRDEALQRHSDRKAHPLAEQALEVVRERTVENRAAHKANKDAVQSVQNDVTDLKYEVKEVRKEQRLLLRAVDPRAARSLPELE